VCFSSKIKIIKFRLKEGRRHGRGAVDLENTQIRTELMMD